jgi:ribosomal protein L22
MLNCLLSAKENAKNKEMDLDRMYVKTVCIGKHRRMRGVRYHAKVIILIIIIIDETWQ